MGMKALFQCDDCGNKKLLSGNIAVAVDHVTKIGWVAGSKVLCPECVAVRQDSRSISHSQTPVEVHSDGSCIGSNPGYGGWGWTTGDKSGSGPADEHPSTNQRMEIKAAVEALKNNADPVLLYTDSSYVANCINKKWYVGWQRNGWVNSSKQPVKNQDLWQELVSVLSVHPSLEVRWVKGHNGNELNEKADVLARTAAEVGRANRNSG